MTEKEINQSSCQEGTKRDNYNYTLLPLVQANKNHNQICSAVFSPDFLQLNRTRLSRGNQVMQAARDTNARRAVKGSRYLSPLLLALTSQILSNPKAEETAAKPRMLPAMPTWRGREEAQHRGKGQLEGTSTRKGNENHVLHVAAKASPVTCAQLPQPHDLPSQSTTHTAAASTTAARGQKLRQGCPARRSIQIARKVWTPDHARVVSAWAWCWTRWQFRCVSRKKIQQPKEMAWWQFCCVIRKKIQQPKEMAPGAHLLTSTVALLTIQSPQGGELSEGWPQGGLCEATVRGFQPEQKQHPPCLGVMVFLLSDEILAGAGCNGKPHLLQNHCMKTTPHRKNSIRSRHVSYRFPDLTHAPGAGTSPAAADVPPRLKPAQFEQQQDYSHAGCNTDCEGCSAPCRAHAEIIFPQEDWDPSQPLVQPLHHDDLADLPTVYHLLFVREDWGKIKRLDECKRHKSLDGTTSVSEIVLSSPAVQKCCSEARDF
ncbi:hypothetical protein Anapl_05249 [Anas platyrhynchos]|uniref:Uncharacterized protein n=1 Tax=Anas platyrhynchos TaxID=8839 RepID=R0JTQ8_ANAPL|nr:hypothetical protein Anapl_05249 [Anas platyrhynchos]